MKIDDHGNSLSPTYRQNDCIALFVCLAVVAPNTQEDCNRTRLMFPGAIRFGVKQNRPI